MIYALESSDARHWAPQDYSRIVSFDFSGLRNAHGSVYDAAQTIAICAAKLSSGAHVLVYKQFLALSGGPSDMEIIDALAETSGLPPSGISVAEIPPELRDLRGSEAVWWAVFMWARARRASGDVRTTWDSVSRDLAAVVGTPPPVAPAALRPLRRLTLPADEVARYFDGSSATRHIAVVQDFVGYNRRTTWGGISVGVGVTDELSRELGESRSFSDVSAADFQRLFVARRRLQEQVDQFELDLRDALRPIPGAALIPGGADGSLGNDGALIALPENVDPARLALVSGIAEGAGFSPATLTLSDAARSVLVSSERCLAAMKASLHVGQQESAQMAGLCRLCRSSKIATAPLDYYLEKQSSIYSACAEVRSAADGASV